MTPDPPEPPEQGASALSYVDVGDGPLVTMVHGFGQTRRCWGPLVDALASTHRCRLVDAPGHGGSDSVRADLWACGRLLLDVAGGGVLLGYSMGARMALHAALLDATRRGGVLRGLVLISVTAGIEDDDERAERRASDARLADRIEQEGVARFVDEWLAGPLFTRLPSWARYEEERRSNTPAGLAASLRDAGTGQQEPLWARLPEIAAPTLVVTGDDDTKFSELGRRLTTGLSTATHAAIPGAGHSTHLEAPEPTIERIRAFVG